MFALHPNKSKQAKIKAAVAAADKGKVDTKKLSTQLSVMEESVKKWVKHFSEPKQEDKPVVNK